MSKVEAVAQEQGGAVDVPNGYRLVQFLLPAKLYDDLTAQLEGRGTDLATFMGVAARGYLRMPSEFDLTSKLPFKKYSGELLEDIIRLDPSYVRWMIENIQGFRMSVRARTLLEEVDPG